MEGERAGHALMPTPTAMSQAGYYTKKIVSRFFTRMGIEKSRIRKMQRFTQGYAHLLGRRFYFHDNLSFLTSYHEIFEREIYRFQPHPQKDIIIDCGASIGVAVLFFSIHYPTHKILAFEPDAEAFDLLKKNVATYSLSNVKLMNKAVWCEDSVLDFYSDGGLGGRLLKPYDAKMGTQVQCVRLSCYLNNDVDFLKIDIEGAEASVLNDCAGVLHHANKIFFEYHSPCNQPQQLHQLLLLLTENGFRYHLKESCTRNRPFVENGLLCNAYDMAINVFAYPHNADI